MLWAGILFIWELVGIDLEKAKEAGGNVGAIIGAIKSPQAVPWALLILVGYFLFKVTVEWYQSSRARRQMRVARIDFSSSWVVALIAYVLYFGQAISRVQVADILQSSSSGSLAFGLALGVALAVSVDTVVLYGFDPKDRVDVSVVMLGPFVVLVGLLISNLTNWHIRWKTAVVVAMLGLVVESVLFIAISARTRTRWMNLVARLRGASKT